MKHEGWEVLTDLGLDVGEEQIGLLEQYQDLLVEVAIPMGMIARSDAPRLRERHLVDCLRAAPLIPQEAETGCDMGSGAGLPGIPLAIACPDLRLTLVEVRRNRATFLEQAISTLGLNNVTIHARRLETFRARNDVCFARAFGKAGAAWEQASRILAPDGVLIYWAGERFELDADGPAGVRVDLFPTSALARSGPLAIMSAQ